MQSGPSGPAPSLNSSQIGQDQTKANVSSGISSSILNNTNQVTPFGNLTYSNSGGAYDYNGNWIPSYTATTSLSPGQQGLQNSREQASQGLFNLAQGSLPAISEAYNRFANYGALPDTKAFTDQAYNALTARTNTDIGNERQRLQAQNANQGVAAGSDAYNRSYQPVDRMAVDASNQATIGAQTLADMYLNREVQRRQQDLAPLQAYGGLLNLAGGGQQMPQFMNTPQYQLQAPDVTSPQLAAFQAQNQAYQNSVQQAAKANQGMMGGLFGLAGAGLGGALAGPLGSSLGSSLFGLGAKAVGSGTIA